MKLFFTSDIHGYFYPSDYISQEDQEIGMFRNLNQINKTKDDLLIDCGDMLYGSALVNYLQRENRGSQVAKIMNDLGYDIVTLGNHDFNFSYSYLKTYLNNLNADITCVNVLEDGRQVYPSIIKEINGKKIGFIGSVTDYVNVWESKESLENATVIDSFTAVKKEIAKLRSKVDLIVGIYHGGFEVDLDDGTLLQHNCENRAYEFATKLDLDILLTGHQHLAINKVISNTLVVQVRNSGLDLIEIDLEKKLDENAVTFYHPTTAKNSLEDKYASLNKTVNTWLDVEIGKLDSPLMATSRVEMAINGSELADFLNKVQLHYTEANISAVALSNNPVGFNNTVTRRDVLANYPFPNTLLVLEITGKNLLKCLERDAEYLEYIDDDFTVSDDFTKPKLAHYNFDFYGNLDYQFDFKKEIGNRVIKFKYQGREIKDDDVLTIAVNNYRASGGGEYECYRDCKIVQEIKMEIADLIIDYFENEA